MHMADTTTPAISIEFRGKTVDALRFERTTQLQGGEPVYSLRFFNGRKQVERVDGVNESTLVDLVGADNADTLKTCVVDRAQPIENGTRGFGMLKGDQLKRMDPALENSIEPDVEIDQGIRNWIAKRWDGRKVPAPTTPENRDPIIAENRTSDADEHMATAAGEPAGIHYRRIARDRFLAPVPAHVARRFAQGEKNRYYFDQQRLKLAFVDKGLRLETKDASPVVAEALVGIAVARGWETMRVGGSKDFKREVWLAAELAGAKVVGYDPTEADKTLLQQKFQQQGVSRREAPSRPHTEVNTIAPITEADKASHAGRSAIGKRSVDEDAVHLVENSAKGRKGAAAGSSVGKVLAHGSAHYQHNKENDLSYFVRLQLASGKEVEIWGKDLRRAMIAGHVGVGDTVTSSRIAQKTVLVRETVRDGAGKVVGDRPKDAVLNGWLAEKAKDFRTLDPARSLTKHPDLLSAHAAMATTASALANQYPNMADTIKEKFRERLAEKIERQEVIPAPKVNTAKVEQKRQARPVVRPGRRDVPSTHIER
jgi:hypothetical protein